MKALFKKVGIVPYYRYVLEEYYCDDQLEEYIEGSNLPELKQQVIILVKRGYKVVKFISWLPWVTPEKVLQLEELIINHRITNYFAYKASLGGYYCQWLPYGDRITTEGKTRTEALERLLIKLLDDDVVDMQAVKAILEGKL